MSFFINGNVLAAVKMGFAAWALLTLSLAAVYAVVRLVNVLSRKRNKD